LASGGPASIIDEARNAWLRSNERLDEWLSALKAHSTAIADEKQRLEIERQLWELTQSTSAEVELPEALRKQVAETRVALEAAEASVLANRDAVLTLQSEVAREKAAAEEMVAAQQEEITRRRSNIFGIDSPPLWRIFTLPGLEGAPSEELASIWSESIASIRTYLLERQDRLVRQALFFVILTVAFLLLHRRAALWMEQDRSLQSTVDLLQRPLAASFIITMLLSDIFHPRAPRAWINLMGFLLLLALMRILPRMLPASMKAGAYLLALVYFLDKIMDLVPDGSRIDRLALLAVALTAAVSCRWLLQKARAQGERISQGWRQVIIFGGWAAFTSFVGVAIANLVGAVGLAAMVVQGTLASIYVAILIWVAAMSLQAIVRVALLTTTAKKLGVVRFHAETVRGSLFRVIRVLAVIGWMTLTLAGFGALTAVVSGTRRVLQTEISIGDFSVIPADIGIFIVVVWLAFKVSQLLRFVLDTDVLPHMDLPRGVPAAINRLSHYAIVVAGVMIAATAAGLDFSRINLIVGALGVGIGFGLQNVVSNFVSGLILLFERPIRVGDKVQLDQLSGTVRDIGMRASIVLTWDGAEVIVPNANLISSEVINWTLSDERRRVEIPVGVAYGTDPQTVLDLLLSVATDHPDVLTDPEPAALFLGFGDSSLNFELRAWTGTDFLSVASELRVAVSHALDAAGMEIPFPQRDLHLRSVDAGAAKELSTRGAMKRENGAK
jgi:small-conductance mechanosensitive channel